MSVLELRRREDCLRHGLRAITVVERLVLGKPGRVGGPTQKVAIREIDEVRLGRRPVAPAQAECPCGVVLDEVEEGASRRASRRGCGKAVVVWAAGFRALARRRSAGHARPVEPIEARLPGWGWELAWPALLAEAARSRR